MLAAVVIHEESVQSSSHTRDSNMEISISKCTENPCMKPVLPMKRNEAYESMDIHENEQVVYEIVH